MEQINKKWLKWRTCLINTVTSRVK